MCYVFVEEFNCRNVRSTKNLFNSNHAELIFMATTEINDSELRTLTLLFKRMQQVFMKKYSNITHLMILREIGAESHTS